MNHVTIGYHIFVPRKADIVETLFKPINGRTASGYYTRGKGRNRNGINFYYADGTPAVAVINYQNKGREFGFHSFSACPEGIRTMYSICTSDKKRLGIADLGYIASHDLAAAVWRKVYGETV